MMALVKWHQLSSHAQKEVRQTYIYWHYDTTSSSFEDWAEKRAFHVRKDGELDQRYGYCELAFMAEGDE
jgi:hypothetical protein